MQHALMNKPATGAIGFPPHRLPARAIASKRIAPIPLPNVMQRAMPADKAMRPTCRCQAVCAARAAMPVAPIWTPAIRPIALLVAAIPAARLVAGVRALPPATDVMAAPLVDATPNWPIAVAPVALPCRASLAAAAKVLWAGDAMTYSPSMTRMRAIPEVWRATRKGRAWGQAPVAAIAVPVVTGALVSETKTMAPRVRLCARGPAAAWARVMAIELAARRVAAVAAAAKSLARVASAAMVRAAMVVRGAVAVRIVEMATAVVAEAIARAWPACLLVIRLVRDVATRPAVVARAAGRAGRDKARVWRVVAVATAAMEAAMVMVEMARDAFPVAAGVAGPAAVVVVSGRERVPAILPAMAGEVPAAAMAAVEVALVESGAAVVGVEAAATMKPAAGAAAMATARV